MVKNTKSSKSALESLLKFDSKEEKYRHDAEILMFRFLSKVEQVMDAEQISKKELAERIGTSASYITQLFRGHKLVNLITLAKMQDALGITFSIAGHHDNQQGKSQNDNVSDELKVKCA